jgi:2-polyprenyl-3-methyl-5-hydroxy-6-metoxy-1,4-benzoquinol methylase
MFDDRYGCPNVVDIYKCGRCRHCFCGPKLSLNEIGPLYEKYYGRKVETELGSHLSLNSRVARWILGEKNLGQFAFSPNATTTLLDIGSGDCQNLWDAHFLGFNAFGFDVDRTSAEIGARNGLQVRSGQSVKNAYPNQKFDIMQMNQVIEHFVDPADQLRDVGGHLASNGRIFISTPNSGSLLRRLTGRKWLHWHVPYHQHHFSKKSLKNMVESQGWEIVSRRTVTPLVWAILQFRAIKMDSKLGELNETWQSGSHRRGARFLELTFLALVFFPVRLLDVLGLGDCHVMVLGRRS